MVYPVPRRFEIVGKPFSVVFQSGGSLDHLVSEFPRPFSLREIPSRGNKKSHPKALLMPLHCAKGAPSYQEAVEGVDRAELTETLLQKNGRVESLNLIQP